MDQLSELYQILDKEQVRRLGEVPLSPTENDYLQALSNRRSSENLSESHTYKLSSVVTRKILDHLFADPVESILWLKEQGLYKHMAHRMVWLGKKLESTQGLPATENFYLRCIHQALDIPFRYYNEKLVKTLADRYMAIPDKKQESRINYIKYHTLFATCNRAAASKDPFRLFREEPAELSAAAGDLLAKGHYGALFYLYRCLCSYYTYMVTDHDRMLDYLDRSIALVPKVQHYFTRDMNLTLRAHRADALLRAGAAEEAYRVYKEILMGAAPDTLYGLHYHAEHFAVAALATGRTKEAGELIHRYFEDFPNTLKDVPATRKALIHSKLFLSSGDVPQALSHLREANRLNEKTYYQPFMLQIRILETITFILKKDVDFALSLCIRNQKYLAAQKDKKKLLPYKKFWDSVSRLLNASSRKKTLPAADEDYILLFQQHFLNLYAHLPSKMLEAIRAL
ncbi:MAG: hypothetical protein IT233_02990 [Bacteroidia bacterium]|nr:hypothetical protein [Bacteroidia bacterium]